MIDYSLKRFWIKGFWFEEKTIGCVPVRFLNGKNYGLCTTKNNQNLNLKSNIDRSVDYALRPNVENIGNECLFIFLIVLSITISEKSEQSLFAIVV